MWLSRRRARKSRPFRSYRGELESSTGTTRTFHSVAWYWPAQVLLVPTTHPASFTAYAEEGELYPPQLHRLGSVFIWMP